MTGFKVASSLYLIQSTRVRGKLLSYRIHFKFLVKPMLKTFEVLPYMFYNMGAGEDETFGRVNYDA